MIHRGNPGISWLLVGVLLSATAATAEPPIPEVAQPPRVIVFSVERLDQTGDFYARLRSWFDAGTRVELRTVTVLDEDSIVKPTEGATIYAFISQPLRAQLRIYLSMRDPSTQQVRHGFREMSLESGLDEVGVESLAEVIHSSAAALWQHQQQVSEERLLSKLHSDLASLGATAPASDTVPKSVPSSPPKGARRDSRVRIVSAFVTPVDPIAPDAQRTTRSVGAAIGASYAAYRLGDEGWQFAPGGFVAIDRGWSLRVTASYLRESSFDVGPARVTLGGVAFDARLGAAFWGSKPWRLRMRPEIGIGLRRTVWSATANVPAVAAPGDTSWRDYGVGAWTTELLLGPIWVGIRGELLVTFRRTSYDVQASGAAQASATSQIGPGIGLEIGIPFTQTPID
jgi:hypothetical protein